MSGVRRAANKSHFGRFEIHSTPHEEGYSKVHTHGNIEIAVQAKMIQKRQNDLMRK